MVTTAEELYYRRYLNDVIPGGGPQSIPIPYFPITSFSDNFTRASGDMGYNWMTQGRPSTGSSGQECGGQILNNKAHFTAPILGGNSNNNLNNVLWIPRQLISSDPNTGNPGGIWGKNQYAKFTFGGASTTSSFRIGIVIFAKHDEGGSINESQRYQLNIHYTGGVYVNVELWKAKGGQNENGNVYSLLGSNTASVSIADVLELDGVYTSNGSSVTVTYLKNNVQLIQATDSSPLPQIGYPAIDIDGSLGTTSFDMSSFSCGTL